MEFENPRTNVLVQSVCMRPNFTKMAVTTVGPFGMVSVYDVLTSHYL